jgi:hypothetical protein
MLTSSSKILRWYLTIKMLMIFKVTVRFLKSFMKLPTRAPGRTRGLNWPCHRCHQPSRWPLGETEQDRHKQRHLAAEKQFDIFNRLSICLSLHLYFCAVRLSVNLFVCLSVNLFVCLSVCLSICLSFCLYLCLSVCSFAHLSVHLSVHLSICLFICPSVCSSVC